MGEAMKGNLELDGDFLLRLLASPLKYRMILSELKHKHIIELFRRQP